MVQRGARMALFSQPYWIPIESTRISTMNINSSVPNRSSRRAFCAAVTVITVSAMLSTSLVGDDKLNEVSKDQSVGPPNADVALRRLLEGNQRFATGKARHPHETADWRVSLEAGQHPFAVVLGCADSRVSPELLF